MTQLLKCVQIKNRLVQLRALDGTSAHCDWSLAARGRHHVEKWAEQWRFDGGRGHALYRSWVCPPLFTHYAYNVPYNTGLIAPQVM